MDKYYIMQLFQFLISKKFWAHFAISISIIVVGLIVLFMWLGSYTRQGESITVPNLKGFKEHQITNALDKMHLRYTIIDSVHKADAVPGAIIEQIPAEGTKVKKNRMLFVTINAFTAEQVKMPGLVDYSLRNAEVMLEAFGLSKGQIIYMPSEYSNLVLGQKYNGRDIATGTLLPKGAVVDLVVGQGLGNETVDVPDLIGLTLEEARQYLSAENMQAIGAIMSDDTVTSAADSVIAIIYKQTPPATEGAKMTKGASLNVWITTNMDLILEGMSDTTKVVNDDLSFENL